MNPLPDPGAREPPTIEHLASPRAFDRAPRASLSDHFEPFLPQFVEGTLGAGGEVVVARDPTSIVGLLLYHPAERFASVFTRERNVALSLLAGVTGLDVFSEVRLAPGSETFHLYMGDLTTGPEDHRFVHPVRAVREGDREALLSLLREVYGRVDQGWFRPIPRPPERGFVVEVGGHPAGAGWVSLAGTHARLHSLSVRAPYRRLGIGTDLWYARTLWARAQGATRALMEVSEHNRPSQAIAAAGGMQRAGEMYRSHRP